MRRPNRTIANILKTIRPLCCGLLLLSGPAFSQQDRSVIQTRFENYTANNYQEKVFLHTDKSVYVTGDVIWFTAYITDAFTNQLSPISKICYVEILSADNKAVLQGKIAVDSGKGNGSFMLAASLRTGNYLLRAYTSWMKNFEPRFYFEQPITIINPGKKSTALPPDSLATDIQFFPEGGNLVNNLKSTVACKISNAYGRGLDVTGFIVTNHNDTVTNFRTRRFGMGTFSLSPQKGLSYRAVLQLAGRSVVKELPPAYDSGWVMHMTAAGNLLRIEVACSEAGEATAFLFAQTRHSVKYAVMSSLAGGKAVFNLPKAQLGDGITQLTLFNQEKQPVCERLYFKPPAARGTLQLDSIRPQYGARNKVSLQVTGMESDGHPAGAKMSMAVYLADSLQPEQASNIVNYLWLTSEVRGEVESPDYYFGNPTAEKEEASDNLMLTQGWRRFHWDNVLHQPPPAFSFLPEYEGPIITGHLAPKMAGLRDTGITVYLSVPGKDFKFSNSVSATNGAIRFNLEKFYGNREVIVQTNVSDSNYRVFIDNPFSELPAAYNVGAVRLAPSDSEKILLRSIGIQAQHIYLPETENSFTMAKSPDTTAFYGKPPHQYYLDAYTRFPTTEEVMREYVKEVHVRKKDNRFHYEVFNEPYIVYFDKGPLVLIDGVPVFDVNKIIDMDPLKIEKVAVITAKFYKGNEAFDGIVSYGTYNGDLDGYQLDPNSLVVEYDGLQLQREFYAPQYDTRQQRDSHIPDYRNVLYWNPNVNLRAGKDNMSFYTSDVPGRYIIAIQGITDDGMAHFATANFTVAPSVGQ